MISKSSPLLIDALLRRPIPRTPVWFMRQAGRYLPEYRAIRARAGSFMALCRTPELACEVTLQPLRRFRLDAAILFSDILTIPDAMGLGLNFVEGEGPRFERPIRSAADVAALPIPDPERELQYVLETIRLVKRELGGKTPLIGFAGSPWTLACYMVEGGAGRDFREIKRWLYGAPELLDPLLDKLSQAVSDYLSAQIAAGVDVVMLFDTWGGILPTWAYLRFALGTSEAALKRVRECHPSVPAILFTKGGGLWLEAMAASGFEAIGLDWVCDIGEARERVGHRVALQGNLDPAALYSSPEAVRREVERILDRYGFGSGHIFNLGHGIVPQTPPEQARIAVDAVHRFSGR